MYATFDLSPYFIFLILFLATTRSNFPEANFARSEIVLETPYKYFEKRLLFHFSKD